MAQGIAFAVGRQWATRRAFGSIRQLTVSAFCGNVRGHNKFPSMGI
jgi:hypothetical protein